MINAPVINSLHDTPSRQHRTIRLWFVYQLPGITGWSEELPVRSGEPLMRSHKAIATVVAQFVVPLAIYPLSDIDMSNTDACIAPPLTVRNHCVHPAAQQVTLGAYSSRCSLPCNVQPPISNGISGCAARRNCAVQRPTTPEPPISRMGSSDIAKPPCPSLEADAASVGSPTRLNEYLNKKVDLGKGGSNWCRHYKHESANKWSPFERCGLLFKRKLHAAMSRYGRCGGRDTV